MTDDSMMELVIAQVEEGLGEADAGLRELGRAPTDVEAYEMAEKLVGALAEIKSVLKSPALSPARRWRIERLATGIDRHPSELVEYRQPRPRDER